MNPGCLLPVTVNWAGWLSAVPSVSFTLTAYRQLPASVGVKRIIHSADVLL